MVYVISDVVITFKAHGLNYVRKFYECRRYISLLYTEVKNDSKEKNISFFCKKHNVLKISIMIMNNKAIFDYLFRFSWC